MRSQGRGKRLVLYKESPKLALAHDLLDRFLDALDISFVEEVEPQNNLGGERFTSSSDFRNLSGGNQFYWGARFIERLMTVACILKQNAKNTLTFLTELFDVLQSSPPSTQSCSYNPLPPCTRTKFFSNFH